MFRKLTSGLMLAVAINALSGSGDTYLSRGVTGGAHRRLQRCRHRRRNRRGSWQRRAHRRRCRGCYPDRDQVSSGTLSASSQRPSIG